MYIDIIKMNEKRIYSSCWLCIFKLKDVKDMIIINGNKKIKFIDIKKSF